MENNLKDLAIYQDLLKADPRNALLQQGLAIAYVNTAASSARAGKIPLALDYSNRGLEIMRPLTSAAPEKAFQRGLFAAMLVLRGTVLITANKPESAIPEVERGCSIYGTLAASGGTSSANLAACYVKLAEAEAKARHSQKAEQDFHQALTIAEPLIKNEPPDLDALYAAADAYSGLADLTLQRSHGRPNTNQQRTNLNEARSLYQLSLDVWHRISHPNHTAPNSFQVGDPVIVSRELKRVDAALANLH